MREVVGRRPAQDIFRDNRQAIAADVRGIIQATMDGYGAGISINAVAIEDAAPPREVADAFDEVLALNRTKTVSLGSQPVRQPEKLGAATRSGCADRRRGERLQEPCGQRSTG